MATSSNLDFAILLADAADAVSLRHFRSAALRTSTKEDGTPVSQVDLDVEQTMTRLVRETFPGDDVLGEEVGELRADLDTIARRRWIFDGIDGTHNYAPGRTGWATVIALAVDDVIEVGVLSAPALGKRWWAERDGGAWTAPYTPGAFTTEAAVPMVCSAQSSLDTAAVIVTPFDGFLLGWRNDMARRFSAPPPPAPRSQCFAIDAAMAAAGEVDVTIVLLGGVWDFAAPSLIINEAGGEFRDAWGQTRLDASTGVFTNRALLEPVLATLAELRPPTPDRPRLAITFSTPIGPATGHDDVGEDTWRNFGIRGLPSMSARQHVDNAPPVIADIVDGRAAQLAAPLTGVTTDGVVLRGLRSLDESHVSTRRISEAASTFLQALTPEQRARASYAMPATEWRTWLNVHMNHFRHGLLLEDLPQAARELALDVVRTTLSARGYSQARNIMRLNQLLAELTGDFEAFGEWPYFMSIFGTPGGSEPWGWQIDGHHLCVNAAVFDGRLVMTPTFMGSEPRRVHNGPYAGISLFDPEEAFGLDLIRSMDTTQQAQAIIYPSLHPNDISPSLQNLFDGRMQAGGFHDNAVLAYQGVAGGAMTDAQRRVLTSLAATYVGWADDPHAAVKMTEVTAHLDETWFSWYGGTSDDAPFYYRVHSPVILIEFDHHPGVAFDNEIPSRHHVHTVVRTPNGGDYGADLLREHHERFDHSHGHHEAPSHSHSHSHSHGDHHHHH